MRKTLRSDDIEPGESEGGRSPPRRGSPEGRSPLWHEVARRALDLHQARRATECGNSEGGVAVAKLITSIGDTDVIPPEKDPNIILTSVDKLMKWGRSNSLWPLGFGLACCAMEMFATIGSHYDIARFGSEVFRSSPRQADLIIVPGPRTKQVALRAARV